MRSLAPGSLSVILLCGLTQCATPPQPRTAVFNEAEYARFAGSGTGVLKGQAFLKTVAGDVKYAAGNTIYLHPVTTYSTEFFQKTVMTGQRLAPADPRAGRYHRKTVGDGTGHFEFRNLPAGDYYVYTAIVWGIPSEYAVLPTGGAVGARVSIHSGQTTEIILTR